MTAVGSAWSRLGEGSTPLVHAPRLSRGDGLRAALKCEGSNPTGSFKDRGMVVAVGRAAEAGARAVVCASTGNTAASAAAYAARAGLAAVVLTPAGATATAKRAQARGSGRAADRGARLVRRRAPALPRAGRAPGGYVLVNSVNPDRVEGQKAVVVRAPRAARRGARRDRAPVRRRRKRVGGRRGLCGGGRSRRGSSSGRPPSARTTWASAIRIAEPAHADACRRARRSRGASSS